MDLLYRDAQAISTEEGVQTSPVGNDAVNVCDLPKAPVNGLAVSLERKRLQFYTVLLLADVALLLGAFLLASVIYHGLTLQNVGIKTGLLPAYLLLPIYLTVALYNGTYSRDGLSRPTRASLRMYAAMILSAAILNVIAFLAKSNAEFSRVIFVTGTLSAAIAMTLLRLAFSRWMVRHWGPNPINQLVIHAGGPKFTLPYAYHIDADEHGLSTDMDNPAQLDRLAKYLCNMDEIIVSCADEHRLAWAHVMKSTGRHAEIISEFTREIGALGVVHHPTVNVSSLLVSTGALRLRDRALKRIFDVSIASAALIVLSPLMLAVALAIKLQDNGPVFFKQRRMGRGNQFFNIYKFRSMKGGDADGTRSASKDDVRVTPLGRLIRKTSIDELPQLLNVIKGDMSLVGPRPHALGSRAGDKLFWNIDRKYWQRHNLRPGITGLAQVRGFRGATDHEKDLSNRLAADLEYLEGWSLWHDIRILFATVTVLIHHRAF